MFLYSDFAEIKSTQILKLKGGVPASPKFNGRRPAEQFSPNCLKLLCSLSFSFMYFIPDKNWACFFGPMCPDLFRSPIWYRSPTLHMLLPETTSESIVIWSLMQSNIPYLSVIFLQKVTWTGLSSHEDVEVAKSARSALLFGSHCVLMLPWAYTSHIKVVTIMLTDSIHWWAASLAFPDARDWAYNLAA